MEERNHLIPEKLNHAILPEKFLCILDHPFIISVVLHGFGAYPRDEEKEESPQEQMDY